MACTLQEKSVSYAWVTHSGHDTSVLGSSPTSGSLLSGEPVSPSACCFSCLCLLSDKIKKKQNYSYVKGHKCYIIFFFLRFERGCACPRAGVSGQRERSQTPHLVQSLPDLGLDPTTLKVWPEPKIKSQDSQPGHPGILKCHIQFLITHYITRMARVWF